MTKDEGHENEYYYLLLSILSLYEILKGLLGLGVGVLSSLLFLFALLPFHLRLKPFAPLSLILIVAFLYTVYFSSNSFLVRDGSEFLFLSLILITFDSLLKFNFSIKRLILTFMIGFYITSALTKIYNSGIDWVISASRFEVVLYKYLYLAQEGGAQSKLLLAAISFKDYFPFLFALVLLMELSSILLLVLPNRLSRFFHLPFLVFHITISCLLNINFTSLIILHLFFAFNLCSFIFKPRLFKSITIR